jgi:protein ImuA
MSSAAALAALQDRIRRIERPNARVHGVLPFRVDSIDRALPGGGLALGALHEIQGAGGDEEAGAAAAGFAANIVGRIGTGFVLWVLKRGDLYGPGLAAHGLDPARIIRVTASRDDDILWVLEEGLREPGIAAVVGEVGRLPVVAGRRLQLAAERSGVTALLLRRWRTGAEAAAERDRPSAALTRWRVAAIPSVPGDEPGIGIPRWRVELLRCRGAEPAAWTVPTDLGGADATNLVPVSAELADRSAAPCRLAASVLWRAAG